MNTSRTTPTWRFIRHFLEMLAAMVLGMLVLGPLWPTIDRVELQALVMATNMTIGMAALMAVRRHAWPGIVEMSAAMYAPFIILFVPYWTGLITAGGLFLTRPSPDAAGHAVGDAAPPRRVHRRPHHAPQRTPARDLYFPGRWFGTGGVRPAPL